VGFGVWRFVGCFGSPVAIGVGRSGCVEMRVMVVIVGGKGGRILVL